MVKRLENSVQLSRKNKTYVLSSKVLTITYLSIVLDKIIEYKSKMQPFPFVLSNYKRKIHKKKLTENGEDRNINSRYQLPYFYFIVSSENLAVHQENIFILVYIERRNQMLISWE